MSRIIKKTASSITPVLVGYTRRTPRRNYSSFPLYSTPKLKNTISRTTIGSLNSYKPPWISDQIICAEKETEDLLNKVVQTPSNFPFKIEDKPWEQTVTLTREYRGDDMKVIVYMPEDHSSTVEERGHESDDQNHDQHKDSLSDPQSSIRLVVTCTNDLGTTLEYGVIAYPDEFSIDSFCIKYANAPEEENIYYKGPDYAKLDKNLQKEFSRRLKIRGILPSTTNFLHEYMANRNMCSLDSSNYPPPPPPTTTSTDQSTPESTETTLFNDEGFAVEPEIEIYRQRGHPLVSAEDIRNSGKNPKDFIWIPYPYTRSVKLLWIEVPSKGFSASDSETEVGDDCTNDDHKLFLDGEAYNANPYRCLPPKGKGDPTVFSEEMDRILYPDLKHMTDYRKAWEECRVALKEYNDEMDKIFYPNGPDPVVEVSDSDLEYFQVYCM